MAEAQEDLEIDQMIIADKLEHHPRMVNKWLRYYYDNEHRILTMKRAREDKFEQLKLELESGDDIRYKSLSQASIKRKIESFSGMKRIDRLIEDQKKLVSYLYDCVQVMKFTFMDSCKALIELRKLEDL